MNLHTKRLCLRSWRLEDAGDLFRYASDTEVAFAAGWAPLPSEEKAKWFIEELLTSWGFFALELKSQKKVIGCIAVLVGEASNYHIGENEGELIYWLGRPYWRQGIMKEAMEAMIRYCREELYLEGLWSGCAKENIASQKLQESCGFQYVKTLPAVTDLNQHTRPELLRYLSFS